MNKLVALSALVIFVQFIKSSPVAEPNEVESTIETSKFSSMSSIFSLQKQDRQRRSNFETTPGLKCWMNDGFNHEDRPDVYEQDCDEIGGAKYCSTQTMGGSVYKACVVKMIAMGLNAMGLNSPTCMESTGWTGDYKICLCEGNLCNA